MAISLLNILEVQKVLSAIAKESGCEALSVRIRPSETTCTGVQPPLCKWQDYLGKVFPQPHHQQAYKPRGSTF